MNLSISCRVFAGIVLCGLGVVSASAQQTALVPLSDPVYRELDRVNELVRLDPLIVGQRPYSVREFCRIAGVARAATVGGDAPAARTVDQLVTSLERFCAYESNRSATSMLVSELDLSAASTNATRRPLAGNFGAEAEATIGSIGQRRLGTLLQPGQSTALELAHRAEPFSWLAFSARERFEMRSGNAEIPARGYGELLTGSARALLGNTALLIGREQLAWAQREGDGLFLASDAPALDQVSLSSDHPFALPGVLRRLGPSAGTIVLADLGASVSRSHSRLLAYKVSVQPTSSFEMGGIFLDHFGGAGSVSPRPLDELIDFLPFVDIFRHHENSDPNAVVDNTFSDKALGLDGRLRIDRLHGIILRGEWLIDDFDVHKLSKLLSYLGSHSLAITVPAVGSQDLSLTLSAKHMGVLTYTHSGLRDGFTTHGRLLGDELGPDAKAFAVKLDWMPSAFCNLSIEGRSAVYSNAVYSVTYADSAQKIAVFRADSRIPNELRDRLVGTAAIGGDRRLSYFANAGVERVRNADFTGTRRWEYLTEIGLRLKP